MNNEIKTDGMHLCIQEYGIKASAWYDKDKDTHAFIRRYGEKYELWLCAGISLQGEKYLENYAQIDLTREQLILLKELIDRKLGYED